MKHAGYTIVELMFVLAIAGVILLLVFEAIPALERSSRNNQRRQDVTSVLRAASQYELNNSGNFPQACGTAPNTCDQSDSTPGYPNDYFLKNVQKRLTMYDPPDISLIPQTTITRAPQSAVTNPDKMKVYNYEKCNKTVTGGATITGAGYSDVVALYALEGGNGAHASQCQQL